MRPEAMALVATEMENEPYPTKSLKSEAWFPRFSAAGHCEDLQPGAQRHLVAKTGSAVGPRPLIFPEDQPGKPGIMEAFP